jgi:hypothetical protein
MVPHYLSPLIYMALHNITPDYLVSVLYNFSLIEPRHPIPQNKRLSTPSENFQNIPSKRP